MLSRLNVCGVGVPGVLGVVAAATLFLSAGATAQPVLPPAPAGVEVTRAYGIEFSTVNGAGVANPGYNGPWNTPENHPPRGGVNYDYRISRTEVTVGQWFEFVQAYQPYFHGTPNERAALQATWIDYDRNSDTFSFNPAWEHFAAQPSWNDAARFANWLTNDKVNAAWAFESGAYDVSTLSTGANQPINDQATRSPGAKFWIPSQDEWLKATYWDSNKNGDGQGGYWAWPNASDTAPVSGPPTRAGATTNASGLPGDDGTWSPVMPVAQYLTSQSPWGLFDTSGGEAEWTEAFWNNGLAYRQVLGSNRGGPSIFSDPIATNATTLSNEPPFSVPVTGGGAPWGGGWGLRLSAAIPSSPAAMVVGLILLQIACRKRRDCHVETPCRLGLRDRLVARPSERWAGQCHHLLWSVAPKRSFRYSDQ